MKILLAIAMTTVFTGTAFGACSETSPQECTTKASCDEISAKSGKKFSFDDSRKVKCMAPDTSVATNCLENNNGSLNISKVEAGGADKDKTGGAAGSTK